MDKDKLAQLINFKKDMNDFLQQARRQTDDKNGSVLYWLGSWDDTLRKAFWLLKDIIETEEKSDVQS